VAVDDAERLRLLRRSHLLDSPSEEIFDRLTNLAVALLQIPISLVTFVEHNRQYFKSCPGLPEPWASLRQTPLSHSFCQYVVTARQPLIVEDARRVALLQGNLAITELGVIAYLGFPLVARGQALGSFCVIDTKPHGWSDWEVQVVEALAGLVNDALIARLEPDNGPEASSQVAERTERLRRLANQTPLIIWQTDRRGDMVFLNTTWSTVTGLSEYESRGSGWIAALQPEERAACLAAETRSGGTPWQAHLRVRLRRADGGYREMVSHGRPFTDPQGTLLGYIGTLAPLPARQEGERPWETFLGIVAHELRSPLTTIQGILQLAQRLQQELAYLEDLPAERLQALLAQVLPLLTRAQENLHFQTRLIQELQDFSQGQVSHLAFELAPCDLVAVVRQVVREQHIAHPERVIRWEAPDEAPLLVLGDTHRVQQVVTNYLTNAYKYSAPEQSVQVGSTGTGRPPASGCAMRAGGFRPRNRSRSGTLSTRRRPRQPIHVRPASGWACIFVRFSSTGSTGMWASRALPAQAQPSGLPCP